VRRRNGKELSSHRLLKAVQCTRQEEEGRPFVVITIAAEEEWPESAVTTSWKTIEDC
jgi:hypothetical protein